MHIRCTSTGVLTWMEWGGGVELFIVGFIVIDGHLRFVQGIASISIMMIGIRSGSMGGGGGGGGGSSIGIIIVPSAHGHFFPRLLSSSPTPTTMLRSPLVPELLLLLQLLLKLSLLSDGVHRCGIQAMILITRPHPRLRC